MNQEIIPRIAEVIGKNQAGVILLPPNPSLDAAAAATALYLSLNSGLKNISLVCDNPKLKYDLIGIDKIQSDLTISGDNLVISFPYIDGAIDKVDYNIQDQSFNLIITPRPNSPKLDPQQVKFSYIGGLINFIIVLDCPTLNSLGQVYSENKNQFQGKELINIDRHLTNNNFGSINYVDKSTSSLSQMIFQLLTETNLPIDKDIASNLYYGIAAATNNFTSYSTNADTFEAVAKLLRVGAIKKQYYKKDPAHLINPPTIKTEVKTTTADNDWLKPKIFNSDDLI
jgi:hypothetical protein